MTNNEALKDLLENVSPDVLAVNPQLRGDGPALDRPALPPNGQKKGNKYGAVRTSYRGRSYPSKHQAVKAEMFYLQCDRGLIKGVLEEVPFRLPGITKGGRPITHRVDFGIIELDNKVSWYEAKGKELELGRLKRVQVEQIYKIKIVVI